MGALNTSIILVILMTWFAQLDAKSCHHGLKSCGDSFCCCRKKYAECLNTKLTYIPKLPKAVIALKFRGNNIKTLSRHTFTNISEPNILILDLMANGVESSHNDAFANMFSLKKLNLQNNNHLNYTQFSKSLYNISKNLSTLYLDNTGLKSLPDAIFDGLRHTSIKFIYLRNNSITKFNENAFYHLNSLRTLDLSNNLLRQIPATGNGSRKGHKYIEALNLAHNQFVYWPPWFCDSSMNGRSLYPRLKSLELRGNAIMVLNRTAWSCLKRLQKLCVSENVIQDLNNDIFVDLISLQKLLISYMAKPFKKIEPRAFHNSRLTELQFDNNWIDFKPNSAIPYDKLFTYCPSLTKLLLGYNDIRNITDGKLVTLLSPLTKLTELHLSGARMYKIPENLFSKFTNLTKLYLGSNKIKAFNPNAFINVTKLQVLHLDSNQIQVINDSFPVTLRHSLKELHLANNPFSCAFCASNNNTWFRNWIDISKIKFPNWPSYYQCASPPEEKGTLFQSHHPTEKDCIKKDPMIVAYVTIGVFILVFTVFGIAGYRTRWYIRYYMIKFRKRCTFEWKADPEKQRLLGNEFRYDAYVIYHDNDRAFVRNEILKFMEEDNQYKLFIWDRDFTAGDQTVGIVVDNICKSNHVIAVISRRFLKDQWCDFQLAVSVDRQIELKRNYLTLLILEDVDKNLLNKSWCVLFTKTPVAEWCNKKNDIRRKLYEQQILSVPRMFANRAIGRRNSINDDVEN